MEKGEGGEGGWRRGDIEGGGGGGGGRRGRWREREMEGEGDGGRGGMEGRGRERERGEKIWSVCMGGLYHVDVGIEEEWMSAVP